MVKKTTLINSIYWYMFSRDRGLKLYPHLFYCLLSLEMYLGKLSFIICVPYFTQLLR